jgi:hypothetical protein
MTIERSLKWNRKGDRWVATGTAGQYTITRSVLPGCFYRYMARYPDGRLACSVDRLGVAKAWCEKSDRRADQPAKTA